MKRRIMCVSCIIMMLIMIVAMPLSAFADNKGNEDVNRYNVVFVIDGSGSIKASDKEGWRYEAIDYFMALLTDKGNNVGSIVFDDDIIAKQEINSVDGVSVKKVMSDAIKGATPSGWTDIGGAINEAVNMLEKTGDKNLPSVILLMSDGNTEFPEDKSEALLEESLKNKQNAINVSQEKGYKIYSVCLNYDGTADPAELKAISDSTGGQSMEVKRAEDLTEVFNAFYNMIYSTETGEIYDGEIPDDGVLDVKFKVPPFGVEEINIIIRATKGISDISLFHEGKEYPKSEIDKTKTETKHFTIIKLVEPAIGEWTLRVVGVPKDYIKINTVSNYRIYADAELTSSNTEYLKNEDIGVKVYLCDANGRVNTQEAYDTYEASVIVKNKATNEVVNEIPMSVGTLAYEVNVNCDFGSYILQGKVMVDDTEKLTNELTVSVENSDPVANVNPIVCKIKKTPVSEEYYTYDLTNAASDPEGSKLKYEIISSIYTDDVVNIDSNNVLKIKIKDIHNGDLIISANDEHGGKCEIECKLKVTNVNAILGGSGTFLFILAALLILLPMIKVALTYFRGDVMLTPFSHGGSGVNGAPRTDRPGRGKVKLSSIIDEGNGIDLRNSYLIPTMGRTIKFKSKKPYYVSNNPDKPIKKFEIKEGIEVEISENPDFDCGIKIYYLSDNDNY